MNITEEFETFAEMQTDWYRRILEEMTLWTESPIEDLFLLGFLEVLSNSYLEIASGNDGECPTLFSVRPGYGWDRQETIGITPQFNVYEEKSGTMIARVDFLLVYRHGTDAKATLAVECDGHDFHHATKQQVDRDNTRAAMLMKEGFPVVRFSGSRLYRESWKCAHEAVSILLSEGRK